MYMFKDALLISAVYTPESTGRPEKGFVHNIPIEGSNKRCEVFYTNGGEFIDFDVIEPQENELRNTSTTYNPSIT